MGCTQWRISGLVAAAALATAAFAQPMTQYEFSAYPTDLPTLPDVQRQIEFNDLIAFYDLGAGAFFEQGWIDPNNGVNAHFFAPFGCLAQYDGIENAFVWETSTFWVDDPSCFGDPACWMPEFTNGDGTFAVPLADFARASNVIRYDFDEPTDIGEILVWTEFEDPTSGRVFMNYDVYVSYDDSTTDLTPLALDVRNGEFGISVNSGFVSSYTLLYDCASDVLATGVTKVRIVFYPVTYQGSDLFVDPWRGYWHPANGTTWNDCETTIPTDPRDVDGRSKPFVASWIAEIDMLAPQGLPLAGDGNGDDVIDATDVALFVESMTGPDGAGGITYEGRGFDFPAKDCDIDLADLAGLQAAYGS